MKPRVVYILRKLSSRVLATHLPGEEPWGIGDPVPKVCARAPKNIAHKGLKSAERRRPICRLEGDASGLESMARYTLSARAIIDSEPFERSKKTVSSKSIRTHLEVHVGDENTVAYMYNREIYRTGLKQTDMIYAPSGQLRTRVIPFGLYDALRKRTKTQYARTIRLRLICALLKKQIAQIPPTSMRDTARRCEHTRYCF